MTVEFPPTRNPCPFCELAPIPHCHDAKQDCPGILGKGAVRSDGTDASGCICSQGWEIAQRRLKMNEAREASGRPEFAMPPRFASAKIEDGRFMDKKHPERNWQSVYVGKVTQWVSDAIHQRPERQFNMVISGAKSGVGKTYMAAAIVNELVSGGVSAILVEMRNLLGMILRAQNRNESNAGGRMTVEDILEAVRKCEVLVLDDLRIVAVTDYQREVIWDIVNWRYQNMKSTIATTQNTGEQFHSDQRWEPIIRRIAEGGNCLGIKIQDQPTATPESNRRDVYG